ncbi:related to NOP7-component of several different pre-ribosomal particles [Sporisorium reilianum f. sp. reilianum]|uniref:Pescadillo homolog n=1 Tax=Sporisorium reilianum f. sp. reilianum TaxID=72559 RepID=A0A2N8U6R3_9BASI|nr:related to NOP7-component of several different pre-ribosomal particles [Sporisorium reilianum f. sp. reilianum]
MAKMKQKGKSGAAKNYVTRNQAIKKLQVTLADFRRLCILKGIFPRQPKSVRKANKGSTAPTTFFFAKDIAYLQHEPVLQSLREHKTFAKKLSRAIGRREWAAAKNLDESKPTYRLDHIIKERYPTFRDSLKDIDDALSLLTLFANLPATDKVSAEVIASCSRLCAEWQLYVMKTKALKKVFLSIKGIYFQAEVNGETITWLVPYLFTQHIPSDIDFRIMYTFLELYQTLLGFVLFKLYTDENLVYPPKFDAAKDEQAAGFGALTLDPATAAVLRGENTASASNGASDSAAAASTSSTVITASGKKVSAKDVKKQIKAISKSNNVASDDAEEDEQVVDAAAQAAEDGDKFVEQPSKSTEEQESTGHLTTFDEIQAASAASEGAANGLFTPYVFYISRECPRAVIEFVLRSFGALPGRIGWDMVAGAGSAVDEDDARITHHIIDRPVPAGGMKKYAGKRVFVQPQYIVDCANARKLLPAGAYGPGQTLPPHLSPFVDDAEVARRGGYVPEEAREQLGLEADAAAVASEDDSDSDEELEEDQDDDDEEANAATLRPALAALLADPTDAAEAGLLDAAELEAEAAGGEDALDDMRRKHTAALKQAKKTTKASSGGAAAAKRKSEEQEAKEMSKMMMSNRQRKLYEKLNYSSGKRAEETAKLQQKKKALNKKAGRK